MAEELELGELWDDYGIVGDVVVSIFMSFSFFSFPLFCVIVPLQAITHDGDPRLYHSSQTAPSLFQAPT